MGGSPSQLHGDYVILCPRADHARKLYLLTEQTNHQMKRLISILLVLLALTMPLASADCVHVTQTTMQFQGADAIFTLKYNLDFLAKVYIWALGSANVVPEIEARFTSFDNVTIEKLDYNEAVVIAKNVSYYNDGYYFHNSHDFGMTIEKLVVDTPDGSPRTYWNINKTPNIFYEDVWD